MDYTGTTTRVDLIGQLLPYTQNTHICSYPDIVQLCILRLNLYHINAHPTLEARAVERGADPWGCSSGNPLLASVNLSRVPSPTVGVDRLTSAFNMGLVEFTGAYATPPPCTFCGTK